MPDSYFDLSPGDQRDLLELGASQLGMTPLVLEKDVWVCWALSRLFSMPGKLEMAFKGGTSLSKVYNVIDRFSEDIDVTIDYRESAPALTGNETPSQLNKLSVGLKASVLNHTKNKLMPYFLNSLREQFGAGYGSVELTADGEKLYVHYESVLNSKGTEYVPTSVLLEFGGRNITEPNEKHVVTPYLVPISQAVTYPEPEVKVLAMERTYWEKATLIHVECRRKSVKGNAERISRHWYDLFKMSGDLQRYFTVEMYELLESVVRQKKAFYNSSWASYEDCLVGSLRLVPEEALRQILENDFAEMRAAGMFYSDSPTFEVILSHLGKVESVLNEVIRKRGRVI